MGMKSACAAALGGFGVPAGPRVGALIMHDTDRDTDSLSDWAGQGDPAVTVDWRGRDEATLRPSLPPTPPPKTSPTSSLSPPLPCAPLRSPGRGSGSKSTPNQRC